MDHNFGAPVAHTNTHLSTHIGDYSSFGMGRGPGAAGNYIWPEGNNLLKFALGRDALDRLFVHLQSC